MTHDGGLPATPHPEDISRIIELASQGDGSAENDLLPIVYDQLRAMAARELAREAPGQTLQPTALVHEAWLRLVGNQQVSWNGRAHFFGAAARAMRRILVDRARRHERLRHGGGRAKLPFDEEKLAAEEQSENLILLDEVLHRLEAVDSRKSEIVMLRYFAGFTVEETAKTLALSVGTVKAEWAFTKRWIYKEIKKVRD